jgi:hypothetical protein
MADPRPLPFNITTGPLAAYDGYVYTVGGDNNLYKLSTSVAIPNNSAIPILDVSSAVGIQYITIHFNASTSNTEMYISAIGNDTNGNGNIYCILDLDNPILTTAISGIDSPRGLQVYGGYLYVVTLTSGTQTKIIQFDLANLANQQVLSFTPNEFIGPQQLVIIDNNLYIINKLYTNNLNYICKVEISTNFNLSNYNLTWINANSYVGNGGGMDKILISDGTYLYFSYYTNNPVYYNYMGQIDISTSTIITGNYFPNFLLPDTEFYYAVIYNDIFYIDFYGIFGLGGPYDFTIYNLPIYTLPFPCFLEDSKILTEKGYVPIQDLRKGDLVKTLRHDYKAIDIIGKREIYNPALKERIKDQLYKCSKDNFDEMVQSTPLIITGCHSILVDDFISEEQKQKVMKVNGNIYITDNKYRLPACADPRTSVYEIAGNYTIYHLALENDDYYMNYGIYANGLLVETCSKRYLKELSNMDLIE